MKALKTIFAALLAAAMVFGFASCSNDDDDDDDGGSRSITLKFSQDSSASSTYIADFDAAKYKFVYKLVLSGTEDWELDYVTTAGAYTVKYYKGTYTKTDNSIVLTKTHKASDAQGTWTADKVENWQKGTVSDGAITITFTPASELASPFGE